VGVEGAKSSRAHRSYDIPKNVGMFFGMSESGLRGRPVFVLRSEIGFWLQTWDFVFVVELLFCLDFGLGACAPDII